MHRVKNRCGCLVSPVSNNLNSNVNGRDEPGHNAIQLSVIQNSLSVGFLVLPIVNKIIDDRRICQRRGVAEA